MLKLQILKYSTDRIMRGDGEMCGIIYYGYLFGLVDDHVL